MTFGRFGVTTTKNSAPKTISSHKRITIRTVAEDAGVSVSAVSKVLRDAYGVSDSLRQQVQESIARLGYRPNASARGMRGQSYTLGVLLPDLRNPFFPDILADVNSALERTQYQPLLGVSQSAASIQAALIDSLIDRQMDALILVGPRLPRREVEQLGQRIPTVVVGMHDADAVSYDTVNNDDILGAELVIDHLVEQGCRDIAMLSLELTNSDDSPVTIQRELGYARAMHAHGLDRHARIIRKEQTLREVQTAARHLLASRDRPEAIFCWTDMIALEVIGVAVEMGLSVPEDLRIVGYDNTLFCDLAQNSLTSVDQSGEILGIQAARLALERIKGRTEAEHFLVKPRIVVRESSKAAKPA